SPALLGLRCPCLGLGRFHRSIALNGLGGAPQVARQAQLAAEIAHEGRTDRALVPGVPPDLLHGLPARRRVLPKEIPDEGALALTFSVRRHGDSPTGSISSIDLLTAAQRRSNVSRARGTREWSVDVTTSVRTWFGRDDRPPTSGVSPIPQA